MTNSSKDQWAADIARVTAKRVTTECNHLRGISRCAVKDRETGETLAAWYAVIRQSDLPRWWDGTHFKWCPDCGLKLPNDEVGNCTIKGTVTEATAPDKP